MKRDAPTEEGMLASAPRCLRARAATDLAGLSTEFRRVQNRDVDSLFKSHQITRRHEPLFVRSATAR
jgi:hypothetical protein